MDAKAKRRGFAAVVVEKCVAEPGAPRLARPHPAPPMVDDSALVMNHHHTAPLEELSSTVGGKGQMVL